MRGMEKIIMSNFSARSTQIQHKSDFVQFAIYHGNIIQGIYAFICGLLL